MTTRAPVHAAAPAAAPAAAAGAVSALQQALERGAEGLVTSTWHNLGNVERGLRRILVCLELQVDCRVIGHEGLQHAHVAPVRDLLLCRQ